VIDIIGPKAVRHQLDMLQGMAEQYHSSRETMLMLEWLDQRFPASNQYRPLVLDVLDSARSYSLHCHSHPSGLPFHSLVAAIDTMREAMYEDPHALHIRSPRGQGDLAEAISQAGLLNWHDPSEFTCVFSSGVMGTSGNDMSARMIAHKDGRAVLEVEVARLVEWAAWPAVVPSALP
jgi:hypothetical protein